MLDEQITKISNERDELAERLVKRVFFLPSRMLPSQLPAAPALPLYRRRAAIHLTPARPRITHPPSTSPPITIPLDHHPAPSYEMLQRSMAQTDDEEKKVDSVTTALAAKVETANQNIQVVVRERQKIEAQILTKNGERLTVNKAVKNYMKAASAMTNAAHDKEIEAAHLENELSRIRVDTLNTEAHNVQLREMMQKQLTELKDKDKLIEKYVGPR